MLRVATQGVAARPGRLVRVVGVVVLAAAFVTGSLGFAASADEHYDAPVAYGLGGLDALDALVVAGAQPLPSSLVERVSGLPEAGEVVADVVVPGVITVDGVGVQIDENGDVAVSGAVPTLRVWPDARGLLPYRLVEGTAPGGGEVVLDRATGQARGLAVGDSVELTPLPFVETGAPRQVTVSGFATYGRQATQQVGSFVLAGEPLVRQYAGVSETWTAMYLAAASGVSEEELVDAVAAEVVDWQGQAGARSGATSRVGGGAADEPAVPVEPVPPVGPTLPVQPEAPTGSASSGEHAPPGRELTDGLALSLSDLGAPVVGQDVEVQVLSRTQVASALRAGMRDSVDGFLSLVVTFALASIVVGSFVIANTFGIVVSQRSREIALLRALGAGRRAVRRAVRVEAVVVGLAGAVVGSALGVAILHLLAAGAAWPRASLPLSAGAVTPPWTWLVGGGLAMVTTILAATAGVSRAARVRPLAALREVDHRERPASVLRAVLGALLLATTTTGVIVVAAGAAEPWLLLALPGLLLGALVLMPVLAVLSSRLVEGLVGGVGGTAAVLASRSVRRQSRRAAGAANALSVGVGLIAMVAVMLASVRAAVPAGGVDPQLRLVTSTMVFLLLVATGIAVVGVSNTLALAVHERARELGLLRAVGATRGQVRAAVCWEAGLLSGLGVLVGTVVGAVAGVMLMVVLTVGLDVPVTVPYGLLVLVAVGGVGAGLVAALEPATRAARTEITAALATT